MSATGKLDLDSLSYHELQKKCREEGLTASGNAMKLKQRLRTKLVGKVKTKKKFSPNSVEDLICPIIKQLPIDPVMAEDGKLYERAAIMKYFEDVAKDGVTTIKSPVTNEPMGCSLSTEKDMRNIIEFHVRRHDFEKELTDSWNQRHFKNRVHVLTEKAEGGCGVSASTLGNFYMHGFNGVTANRATAKYWYKKAADAGNIIGMAVTADFYANENRFRQATHLMAMAAGAGSDYACIKLGRWYAQGRFNVPKGLIQAKRLLSMAVNGECSCMHASTRNLIAEAKELLQELDNSMHTS